MPKKKQTTRVIYQNEFLYTSFDATGYHFNDNTSSDPHNELRNLDFETCSGNQVVQLHRVQSANYGANTNLIEVNQYGALGRLGFLPAGSPDVTFDFEYLLSEGYNEQSVGFITDGQYPALFNHIRDSHRLGQNFFIVQVPQYHDVIGFDMESYAEDIHVVGIGNAFLTQYAVSAEVGAIAKARLSYEAFNIRGYTGFQNLPIPSVNPHKPTCEDDIRFSIPDTYQSFIYGNLTGMEDISYTQGNLGIVTNNITVSLKNSAAFSVQTDTLSEHKEGSAHIQGFTINVPIGRTKIDRMGSSYSFNRVHSFPMNIEVQIRAVVSELKNSSICHALNTNESFDLEISMKDCFALSECNGGLEQQESSMFFTVKKAHLTSEGFSLDIGDSKIVDLTFSSSIAGLESLDEGLFISGRSFMPKKPNILAWGLPL